jgi:hypothetical protein
MYAFNQRGVGATREESADMSAFLMTESIFDLNPGSIFHRPMQFILSKHPHNMGL